MTNRSANTSAGSKKSSTCSKTSRAGSERQEGHTGSQWRQAERLEHALDTLVENRAKHARDVIAGQGLRILSLLAVYDFPAEHQSQLRTTIRSRASAAVRQPSVRAKKALSPQTVKLMVQADRGGLETCGLTEETQSVAEMVAASECRRHCARPERAKSCRLLGPITSRGPKRRND